jgi:molybdopterin synthase sulfur carrier subunit
LKITIKVFANLREIIGQEELKIDIASGDTVGNALSKLIKNYPALKEIIFNEKGEVSRYLNVFINGRNIRAAKGLDTILKEDDKIILFPPLGGG